MPLEQLDPENLPTQEAKRHEVAEELVQKVHTAMGNQQPLVASMHASDLLMLFPNERRFLDLFDEVVLSAPDPLTLLPVATGAIHVATAAGRARVLMMKNRLAEAVDLLCTVVRIAPDLSYLDWLRRWLDVPHVVSSLSWDQWMDSAVKTALLVTIDVPVPPDPDDPRLPNVRAIAAYLPKLRAAHPDQAVLYAAEAFAKRRMGDVPGGVEVANDGLHRFPQDTNLYCAKANLLGDGGHLVESEQAARHALQLDPSSAAPLHDLAQAHLRHGAAERAVTLFEELLHREPNYPGAYVSLLEARWRARQDPAARQELVALRDRNGHDRELRSLVDSIDPPHNYVTFLPGPGDATANAARHLLAELGPVMQCCGQNAHISISLTSEWLESPSVGLAFDVGLRAMGGAGGAMAISSEGVQSPDPRQCKTHLEEPAWGMGVDGWLKVWGDGDSPLGQEIARIAALPFHRETWTQAARELAQRRDPALIPYLQGAMLNPPPPPQGFDAVYWTYRCQVATAVAIAQVGPYPQGPASDPINALLYGPDDWTTAAGIIAVTWRALEDPSLQPQTMQIFQWLRQYIPQQGYCPWEIVLAESMLALTAPHDPSRADLEQWIKHYEETVGDKNAVRAPERRYGGLTLEQYAEFCMERDRLLGTIAYQGAGAAIAAFGFGQVPAELGPLCDHFGIPRIHPETGGFYPFITEWQEALNADGDLHRRFIEVQRAIQLERHGVSHEEKAALDNILDGNMDMHQRMAQAQVAQAEANDGDPDPVVFPGQPVARLSDYVAIMKRMQTGDMNGALAQYGLDMMSYASVAQAWGAKMAADPVLTEKFSRMMA